MPPKKGTKRKDTEAEVAPNPKKSKAAAAADEPAASGGSGVIIEACKS